MRLNLDKINRINFEETNNITFTKFFEGEKLETEDKNLVPLY